MYTFHAYAYETYTLECLNVFTITYIIRDRLCIFTSIKWNKKECLHEPDKEKKKNEFTSIEILTLFFFPYKTGDAKLNKFSNGNNE